MPTHKAKGNPGCNGLLTLILYQFMIFMTQFETMTPINVTKHNIYIIYQFGNTFLVYRAWHKLEKSVLNLEKTES